MHSELDSSVQWGQTLEMSTLHAWAQDDPALEAMVQEAQRARELAQLREEER